MENAFNMPICGNNATFCGILSKNLFPHTSFGEYHKSFHNLTEFFRNQGLHARAKLHVCGGSSKNQKSPNFQLGKVQN